VLWRGRGPAEKAKQTDATAQHHEHAGSSRTAIYGVCSYGSALSGRSEGQARLGDARGDRRRSVRWANAFSVQQGDRFVLLNEQGDLSWRNCRAGLPGISRANILTPTNRWLAGQDLAAPAFANQCVYARTDASCVRVVGGGRNKHRTIWTDRLMGPISPIGLLVLCLLVFLAIPL